MESGSNLKEKMIKTVYQKINENIEVLSQEFSGCQIFFEGGDEELIRNVLILLENNHNYVDYDQKIVIWEKDVSQKYENLVTMTCKRRCNQKTRGTCKGCQEYWTCSKYAGRLIEAQLVICISDI